MPMDIDYLAAKSAIHDLIKLLDEQPHGKREQIADEIIEFVKIMKKRWPKTQ